MRRSTDLATRIDRLCTRAVEGGSAEELVDEMESLLTEGYLEALRGEGHSRRLAERLEQLVETMDRPEAAVEMRQIVLDKRAVDADVAVLRHRLGVMRDEFGRLRALSEPG